MPIIFTAVRDSDGKRGIEIHDPDADARIGRWCKAPLVPDRCDHCYNPDTLAHYPADGYREEVDPKGKVWRYGTCHRCRPRKGKRG